MTIATNPLLDFSGLPRFDAIRPEHVTPAVDALLADARRAIETSRPTRARPTWDTRRRAARRVARPPRPRVGRRAPPERRREHAGAARRVQREPAEDHRVPHRPRAGPAPVRQVSRAARAAGVRDARRRAEAGWSTTSCATSSSPAPSSPTPARRASRPCRRSSPTCRRSSRTTCSTRPTPGRSTSTTRRALAGVPADVLAEARAAAQADGRAGYKLTLRMPCYLPVMQYAHDRACAGSCTRRTRRARPTSARTRSGTTRR